MKIATLPVSANFLGLEPIYSNLQKSQAVILPLPYEGTTTYMQGTAKGPAAILQASQQVEFFDSELDCEPYQVGIATAAPVEFGGLSHEAALERIGETAAGLMKSGKFLLSLGGEHSITIPLVERAAAIFPELSVLQLDAHSDLRESYHDSRYNHACVMARVNEICDFVAVGLRSGIIDEGKGVRPGARLIYAHQMARKDNWAKEALANLSDNVYLTIDLDFFDPAYMPAVGTPEPGGFGWYRTLDFLRLVFREKNVVACDVVELSPIDRLIHPDFFAAKLCYKLIGYKFFSRL